jgi:hypothetical protein
MVGLGANNSSARIDNVIVQRVPPQTTFSHTEDFSSDPTGFFEESLVGDWTLAGGRYEGDAAGTTAINLTSVNVGSAYIIDLSANLNTTDEGGFVYDQYAADDFKFVTISDGRITLGHRTAKGWFVDMVYSSNSVDTGEDYSLRLNLRGTTVSVLLDDQMVLSKTYNAVVTDGNFGLFSMSGVTSFDTVTFKTDDPAFDNVKFLRAAEQGSGEGVTLTDDALAPIVDEAIARWSSTLESDQIGLLEDATVIVADLPDDILGETVGSTILIDADAAGNGWYIDPTPADDVEFADGGSPEGVDLLTVVMHELGHVLGYEDLPDEGSLMTDTLANGVRYVTTPDTLTSLAGSGWVFDIDIESMTYGDRMAAMQQRLNAAIQSSEGSRSARKLVSLAARNEIEDLSDASMKTDNDWLFDFLINGGEKSDPNSGIAIVL